MNIILGVTGSVAAIKSVRLAQELRKIGDVKAVLTEKGDFFRRLSREWMEGGPKNGFAPMVTEEMEWDWDKIGDPIPHIDLRDWADILVIAPLSANTMAKMANGICDNLLTSIYRAWPLLEKPIVVAPAMNTQMWEHPITREHLDRLRMYQYRYDLGTFIDLFKVVEPVESNLACGTKGIGAMAPIDRIVEAVKEALEKSS